MEREPFDPEEFESTAGAAPWVRRVVAVPELDSTNAEALRLAAAGEPEGLVVVTDAQTSGRGRLGRAWWAEPGTSLLASWLLRPTLEPERLPLLSLVAGVAAARAASAAGGVEVRLKWPNDLLLDGRKLGGILSESDGRGAVVVGLGVNVRQDVFPDDIRETATSLAADPIGCTCQSIGRGSHACARVAARRDAIGLRPSNGRAAGGAGRLPRDV